MKEKSTFDKLRKQYILLLKSQIKLMNSNNINNLQDSNHKMIKLISGK